MKVFLELIDTHIGYLRVLEVPVGVVLAFAHGHPP